MYAVGKARRLARMVDSASGRMLCMPLDHGMQVGSIDGLRDPGPLLDIVVDNYLYVISLLGEKVETLEETLLINPNQDVINEINNYKRELNFIRRNIKPAKEMIFSIAKTFVFLSVLSFDQHLFCSQYLEGQHTSLRGEVSSRCLGKVKR